MKQHDDATLAQIRAADPDVSTWLTANAGSGKTRVLTDRVARLLLHGVDPQNILCLTYTKAAASEMQNRLFKRLGEWAMLDGPNLLAALSDLGEDRHRSQSDLDGARTLFARAIETPGGLKIQTIHSFCAGLLRRFPLEAGVNPQFEEIEDRAAELLREDILDRMATGPDAHLVRDLSRHFTGEKLSELTAGIVRQQEGLAVKSTWEETAARFGITPFMSDHDLEASVFDGCEQGILDILVPALLASKSKPDIAMGAALSGVSSLNAAAVPILQSILLTQAGTPHKRNPTKAIRAILGGSEPDFDAFSLRLADALDAAKTRKAALSTQTLSEFSVKFLDLYSQAKLVRGWLDFDDLILKTRQLLNDPQMAQWVLYRLDGGIGHVLVDEAQDTSPAQWDVIEKLTQDFTSGEGLHDEARTLFVVGDKKQSIYSFQGADPDEFDRMQDDFKVRFEQIGKPLANRSLEFSFRSSDAILRLVDATFQGQNGAGFSPDQMHRAFHGDKPGRVDLWPIVDKTDTKEDRHWTDPVDRTPATHHDLILARHIADQIASLLDPASPGHLPTSENDQTGFAMRRVEPGDVMILVQRRGRLFHEIIRACKQRDIPIAGPDRLRVGAELAVRDLLAVLSFLATPEDDLSLATILRSPLFGWSEKDLFDLAHNRKKGTWLWEALQKHDQPETLEMLRDLRKKVDFLRPYDLIERILTRHDGRRRLLARLGAEAEDGIDALLSQALAYERSDIPSLTGFLSWAQADDLEIKRQVDSSGGLVRVMTVHGAKGLEAPVVILPDCANRPVRIRDEILKTGFGPIWKPKKEDSSALISEALEDRKDAEKRERLRLLYVALTRAETWLIIAAAGELGKDGDDWYQMVSAGMDHVGWIDHETPAGPGRRYQFGDWKLRSVGDQPKPEIPETNLEDLFHNAAVTPERSQGWLSPSELGGAKALSSSAGLPEDIAKLRGTWVHHLIENLPSAGGADISSLCPAPDLLPEDWIETSLDEARRVVSSDTLAWIFAADSLSEVSITGNIGKHRFLGIIDRLVVTGKTVTAVDFKTNLAVPKSPENCPEGILRQLGAYLKLLEPLYPDHSVETGILWTATGEYMSLPQNLVINALWRSPQLDDSAPPT